jgi:LmbE family N-acetylglucosaminyl deacetylase
MPPKLSLSLLIFLGFNLTAFGQSMTSSEILHELQKLKKVGSVLYVAAHPDDENTTLLSYLAQEEKLETAYLSLTRGGGGQNLIGSELNQELGLIRANELLQARRIDGAIQLFTRARDFGYSKNPEDTLENWEEDEVLGDVVYAVRHFRPDVIITRFNPAAGPTHGHHTVSAQLALKAFSLAADPDAFPEQLNELETHQAKRIFWNGFGQRRRGGGTPTREFRR